ncbi:MAG: HAD family phosphatase [Lachnospiraceae bacterium]|nr:HAD family phosphatase [Lachnospiraceae bacterium]
MIRHIIFDIGNVLVAFQWEKRFKSFCSSPEELERLAKATVLSDMWKEYDRGVLSEDELMDGFIRNDPELESVIRTCLSSYSGMLRTYDYTISWIKELKQNGYNVYYLSNMPAVAVRDCADDLEFIRKTDGGILSYSERMVKPDPAIYYLLMERYGLRPEECVFLDDSEKNIKTACALGMQGILFQNKEQACEELRKLGVNA